MRPSSEENDRRLKRYVAERRAALLSLDGELIKRWLSKYGMTWPGHPKAFWERVHWFRTQKLVDMPKAEAALSRRMLKAIPKIEVLSIEGGFLDGCFIAEFKVGGTLSRIAGSAASEHKSIEALILLAHEALRQEKKAR